MKKILYQILFLINIIALILMIVYSILFAQGRSRQSSPDSNDLANELNLFSFSFLDMEHGNMVKK